MKDRPIICRTGFLIDIASCQLCQQQSPILNSCFSFDSSRKKRNRLPAIFRTSRTIALANLATKEEPAAFGWTAAISPDLPIPCERLKENENVVHNWLGGLCTMKTKNQFAEQIDRLVNAAGTSAELGRWQPCLIIIHLSPSSPSVRKLAVCLERVWFKVRGCGFEKRLFLLWCRQCTCKRISL